VTFGRARQDLGKLSKERRARAGRKTRTLEEMETHVGLALVGRTPRPDFEAAFGPQLAGIPFRMAGALDGVADETVIGMHEPGGEYPIHIPIARPGGVDIPVASLRPYLQECIDSLQAGGASVIAVLCAGDLGEFSSPVPLLSSGRIIPALLRASMPGAALGIITPNRGQVAYAERKWRDNGFAVSVEAFPPYEKSADRDERLVACARGMIDAGAQAIVLDCFGFQIADARLVYRALRVPVLAARDIAARAVGLFCGYLRQDS
jgi:protein AroM